MEQISASVRSYDRQRALSKMGMLVYRDALDGGSAALASNSEIIFLRVGCSLCMIIFLFRLLCVYETTDKHDQQHQTQRILCCDHERSLSILFAIQLALPVVVAP